MQPANQLVAFIEFGLHGIRLAARAAADCANSAVTYQGCTDLSFTGGSECEGPSPVGSRPPNNLGVHDELGNVFGMTGVPEREGTSS
ncbi:MAG: hypothetical protein ACJAYU_001052 [Bradymonadia bacterium]